MEFIIHSVKEIDLALEPILEALKSRSIMVFNGSMGAGKTTLIKRICKALGVKEEVSSPTFSIVNEYRDEHNTPVYHFDFYRLKKSSEALDIGFEEYLDSGSICLIEWPEKLGEFHPERYLELSIEQFAEDPLKRRLVLREV